MEFRLGGSSIQTFGIAQTKRLASLRRRARGRRAELFRRLLAPSPTATILDLGGANGRHIADIVPGQDPSLITIADVSERALAGARARGFNTVCLDERASRLPFDDGQFDVLFCSSVIEHVTVPHDEIFTCRSDAAFRRQGSLRQQAFASEIRRVSRSYFVQTPYKHFPVESHSLLPGPLFLLPREAQMATLRLARRYWLKGTKPDFLLFDRRRLQAAFPDADILPERWMGLTKSLIAMRRLPESRVPPLVIVVPGRQLAAAIAL
jgi:hypothetical protein